MLCSLAEPLNTQLWTSKQWHSHLHSQVNQDEPIYLYGYGSCMGCANPAFHTLFLSKDTQQKTVKALPWDCWTVSQRLDHCGCQHSRSTASYFLWWWWGGGRHAAGQGPGGFVIYLSLLASSASSILSSSVRQNFLEVIQ